MSSGISGIIGVYRFRVQSVFDHGVAVPWSDLRKSRSFLGLWVGGSPGSRAKRRRTGRG